MAVDTFTEILRYIVWTVMSILFLAVLGAAGWTVTYRWWSARRRRSQIRNFKVVWDWELDGGVTEPEPMDTEDMYPRAHVSIPDGVPVEWIDSWR